MKRISKALVDLTSIELIAIAYVLFIIPNGFISFGIDGVASLIHRINNISPAVNIVIINAILLLICSIFVDKETIKKYLFPALAIPVAIFINSILFRNYTLELPEISIAILVSGVLSGFGYSLLYRNGYGASVIFLLEDIIGNKTRIHSRVYSWILDIILIIILLLISNYRIAIYSFMIIVISKYMITKARFGINDSKMFYIITKKEDEVKNYILHTLGYELTVLESRGGFTRTRRRMLLSVVDTRDYYKMKTGIRVIDPEAFIAITDTYDVINVKSF